MTDQGPEFVGHEFSTYVGENGCLHHFIDSQSPWQQGRTERAGGSLKEDIRDVVEECAIVTDVDFEIALTQALDARNRYVDRSGFSAQQRVFGASLRLPGCLMAEDPIDRLALSSDPTTEFNRSAQIRDASQRALFRHKDNDAVKRAARARSRVKTHDDIKVGSVVYVWRNSSRSKFRGWVGPGLVVCLGPNGTSAWVSMRGVLVKTNMDRLRVATDSEWVGAELIKLLSADAKQHLERAGQRGYVDATAEEGPEDDEGASPPDPAEPLIQAAEAVPDLSPSQPLATIPEEDVVMEPVAGTIVPPVEASSSTSSSGTSSSSSSSSTPRATPVRRLAAAEPSTRNTRSRSASSVSEPAREPTPPLAEIPFDDLSLREAAGVGPPRTGGTASNATTPRSTPGSSSFAPQGGWIRAEERSRASPYSGFVSPFSGSIYSSSDFEAVNYFQTPTEDQDWESIPEDSVRPANECWIEWQDDKKQLWVGVQATDASSVNYRDLSPSDRVKFDTSRATELRNLFGLKAYRIMSLEESLAFRRDFPECVLPSRWVDRWKAQDSGADIAKSRIVILGFKDPQVLQLERSAPTPTHEAFTTVMQVMASRKWSAWSSDIKNAFGQSRKTTRQQPIAASLPQGMKEAGYDLDPRQLLMAETEVYGLISGPSWLRQSLVADFEAFGYVRNLYDKCVMTLPPSGSNRAVLNEGVILIEVDDILEAGGKTHRDTIEKFYAKYQCGKRKKLQDLGDEGTRISGIRVKQLADFSFRWHMKEYAAKDMLYIDVPRGFATSTTEIPDAVMSKVVSSNGKIGWIGGNGRPDLAAGHSIIAGEYKDKSPNLVASCNQCVKQAKENPIELIVWPIAVADLRLVSFCDSSFDFKGIRHQQGWITGFTNQFLNKNQKAPVSIALWKSRKLPRKAGSPQLVETYAASYATADTNWVRCILYSALYSDFDFRTQRPRHFKIPSKTPTVLRTERPEVIDPEVSLLSDSKGLYDALNNELPQDDKKSAVEMPIIEEMLKRMNGRSRWIPHNVNPSDGLTKLKGAHLAPLMDLMRTGFYHLKTEEVQLKARAEEKEKTGSKQRKKQSGSEKKSSSTSMLLTFLAVVPDLKYITSGIDSEAPHDVHEKNQLVVFGRTAEPEPECASYPECPACHKPLKDIESMRSCAMCRRLCCINCTVFLGLHRGPYCFQCCDRAHGEESRPKRPRPQVRLSDDRRTGDNMQYILHYILYQIHCLSSIAITCSPRLSLASFHKHGSKSYRQRCSPLKMT